MQTRSDVAALDERAGAPAPSNSNVTCLGVRLNVFVLVMARDGLLVESKLEELRRYELPYLVVCGEKDLHAPGVIYREARGKWDAINFGYGFVPPDTDVVVLNDVDTQIHGLGEALSMIEKGGRDLVYCVVRPSSGSQPKFYALADPLRERLHLFASGELMLIRKGTLDRLMPIPPCMAEDSYLLFRAMQFDYQVALCRDTFVTTKRTSNSAEEAAYKERTTLGILQALDYSVPPPWIRLFYYSTPLLATMLALAGEDGRAWARGMIGGFRLHMEGSKRARF
jgi:hypothetical protein